MNNKQTKGGDYVQTYTSELNPLKQELRKKNKNIDIVLDLLTDRMNIFNAVIISYKTMEGLTGLSRNTLYKTIKVLEEADVLRIYKTGTSNIYTLNERYYWKQDTKKRTWASAFSNGKLLKYTQLSANVVLSDDEQTDEIRKRIEEDFEYEQKHGNKVLNNGDIVNKDTGEIIGTFRDELVKNQIKMSDLISVSPVNKKESEVSTSNGGGDHE